MTKQEELLADLRRKVAALVLLEECERRWHDPDWPPRRSRG
jgi:hypothetical protein